MQPQLVIKVNRTVWEPVPCALCGEEVDVHQGLGIYPLNAWEPICRDCAGIHAPELLQVLQAVHRKRQELPELDWTEEDRTAFRNWQAENLDRKVNQSL